MYEHLSCRYVCALFVFLMSSDQKRILDPMKLKLQMVHVTTPALRKNLTVFKFFFFKNIRKKVQKQNSNKQRQCEELGEMTWTRGLSG